MKEKKTLEELIQDYNECKEIFGEADFTSIMIAECICDTYSERKEYDKASEYAKRNYEASLREYGVDEPMTFNLLAKLIKFYEKQKIGNLLILLLMNIIEFEKKL